MPAATPSPISTIAKAPAMIAKVQDLLRHIVVVVYLKCQLELLVVYGFGLKEQQEQ